MTHPQDTLTEPKTPRVVVACGVFKAEMDFLISQGDKVEVIYLQQNLHRSPHLMPSLVQEKVDEASAYAAQIVLGYGLCSNGIVGVRAPRQELIVARAHDCVALLLGSIQEYNRLRRIRPGTYYLTQGWIQKKKDPLGMMENEYIPKMGREMAEWGAREELKHYSHFMFIDTGVGNKEYCKKRTRENARFFGKQYVEVQGDLSYLRRLLFGPYDRASFFLFQPGEKIQQRRYLWEAD